MYCTTCGAKLDDDMSFCTACGASVENASTDEASQAAVPVPSAPVKEASGSEMPEPSSSGSHGSNEPKAKKNLVPIIVVICIVVVAIIVGAILATGVLSDQSSSDAPLEAVVEDVEFKTEDVRIITPGSVAEQGCQWARSGQGIAFTNTSGSMIAELLWGDATSLEVEAKIKRYAIGTIVKDDVKQPVALDIFFWDSQGKTIPASEQGESALESIGVTADDLVSWISLMDDGVYRQAAIIEGKSFAEYAAEVNPPAQEEQPAPAVQEEPQQPGNGYAEPGFISGQRSPFWGVWIGAFRDPSNAANFVEQARQDGFPAGVVISDQWTNLNQGHFYVVYASAEGTESAAQATLSTVQSRGYESYVKYSGNYQG